MAIKGYTIPSWTGSPSGRDLAMSNRGREGKKSGGEGMGKHLHLEVPCTGSER